MPAINLNCDIKQGFDFGKDANATVGYITALSVGEVALVADQTTLHDPVDRSRAMPAVAVLASLEWSTAPADPIQVIGQLSTDNMQTLTARLRAAPASVAVSVEFAVYEYDFLAEKMFPSCRTAGTPLLGEVQRHGAELSLNVATTPASEPHSPRTFAFDLVMMPAAAAQRIEVATADTLRSTLAWGIK